MHDSVIPADWLVELKRRVDLVALGTRYGIAWDTRSRIPKACCPFHEEDIPSFVAMQEPRRGSPRFHCYGCARGWDALAFVQERGGLDFHRAVEELAGLAGMTPPAREQSEAARRAREELQRTVEEVFAANAAAQRYYERALQADRLEAQAARAVLEARGLAPAAAPWGLGYAPPGGGLLEWLRREGVSESIATAACLVQQGDGGLYAWHRDRITFPVRDRRGRVVAHVGRAMQEDQVPKYLNPRETPVYVKAEALFGLYEAAPAIRAAREAVVVEGQTGLLTPWLHGVRGMVATGGTAFGEAHVAALRAAGAERLILCFDGDPAGVRAADAGVRVCLACDMPVRVASLPSGLDPDDFCRTVSATRRFPPNQG